MDRLSPVAWLAAVLGGAAWIPIQLAIGASWSRQRFGLTYVEWNRLMVVPLGLLIVATVGLVRAYAGSRHERTGTLMIAIGLGGMLTGNVVEFYAAGGLAGMLSWPAWDGAPISSGCSST